MKGASTIHTQPKVFLLIKAIAVAAAVIFFLYLADAQLLLVAPHRMRLNPNGRSGYLSATSLGLVRSAVTGPYSWLIRKTPLVITVSLPRVAEKLHIRISLQTSDAPLISYSLESADSVHRKEQILWSQFLNDLQWERISDDGLSIWQRTKTVAGKKTSITRYDTVNDFRRQPPPATQIGVVAYDAFSFLRPSSYTPTTASRKFPVALRGPQSIYFYAGDEMIDWAFAKTDLNFSEDADVVRVNLVRLDAVTTLGTGVVRHQVIADDGVVAATQTPGRPAQIHIRAQGQPGMYRLDLDTTDDVVFQNITTTQHVVGMHGSLNIAAGPAYRGVPDEAEFRAATIRLNSPKFTIMANHPDGKQIIEVGGKDINIRRTKAKFPVALSQNAGVVDFVVAKPDVSIQAGDSLLTFSSFTLPTGNMPGATTISLYPTADVQGVNYLIAPYVPLPAGSMVSVDQDITTAEYGIMNKKIRLELQVPGIDEHQYDVGLSAVRVDVTPGKFPWDKVISKIRRLFGGDS